MCGNEAKVTNESLMEIGETCIQGTCPIQILGELVYKEPAPLRYFLAIRISSFLSLFYLEVNLMPYGFLFLSISP